MRIPVLRPDVCDWFPKMFGPRVETAVSACPDSKESRLSREDLLSLLSLIRFGDFDFEKSGTIYNHDWADCR